MACTDNIKTIARIKDCTILSIAKVWQFNNLNSLPNSCASPANGRYKAVGLLVVLEEVNINIFNDSNLT